jgi:RNA polymerase sigma-70 factor, ECF subfamily
MLNIAERASTALTDEEVVARVRSGDTALFEILMRRYNQRLYRVARGIVRDTADAEDVVQQAYMNAYLHLHQFAGRARFPTWLTRIAINEALARARRSDWVQQFDWDDETGRDAVDDIASVAPDPEREAGNGELRRALESAIDELPPIYRSVFVMREVEQLTTIETAECLGLTEEVVKVRLFRARERLRHALDAAFGLATCEAFGFDGARCDRIVNAVMERLARMTFSTIVSTAAIRLSDIASAAYTSDSVRCSVGSIQRRSHHTAPPEPSLRI